MPSQPHYSSARSIMSRPEDTAPPDVYYNEEEANKYLHNSRMIEIQAAMAERAMEMLLLPADVPCYLLDVGCGTCLSGEVLDEQGHTWAGIDISKPMLQTAQVREVEGDLVHQDMGAGLPFRNGVFDGAISISAIQWLCNADKSDHIPHKRLACFFESLYGCLRRGARAVLQFYPKDSAQMELITSSAMRSGFGGGLVVDFPNSTRAKKYFLVLLAGPPDPGFSMPEGLQEGSGAAQQQTVQNERRLHAKKAGKGKKNQQRAGIKTREWILHKKESQRKQGKEVRADSKYTGRKRKPRF